LNFYVDNKPFDKSSLRQGQEVKATFTGSAGDYSSYQWIQVASQFPNKMIGDIKIPNPFVDGTFVGNTTENYPFYVTNDDQAMIGNPFQPGYYDRPNMTFNNGSFQGEGTLVGLDKNGQINSIISFSLGYSVTDGVFFPAPNVFSLSHSCDTQTVIEDYNAKH